jgi:hypothetical protein
MTVELTLPELENLLMMHDFCKRWFDHEYARSAAAKLEKAKKEQLEPLFKEEVCK